MNYPIDEIVTELRSQLAPIEEEETRLRSALTELKGHRKKLEAALNVLGGGPQKAKPPKRGKTCATKQEVVAIMAELLRANGPMETADLEGLAKDRLSEAGRSLSGFRLRFSEAIRESDFQVDEGGHVTLCNDVMANVA